jgi:thioredoxin 1
MTRAAIALSLALALLGGFPLAPARAATCQFVLGFKALHDLIPAVVGECLVDEHHNPANGDGLQETTGGLLAWRKADNWTAFTDGYRTWVNGPGGLVERLNTQRFCWEGDAATYPPVPGSTGCAVPAPPPACCAAPVAVTASTFDQEVLRSGTPVVVEFWAAWCGPCRTLDPVIREVAQERAGRLKLAKVDVDADPGIGPSYGVASIPTLLVFEDGQVAARIVGYQDEAQLLQLLDQAI